MTRPSPHRIPTRQHASVRSENPAVRQAILKPWATLSCGGCDNIWTPQRVGRSGRYRRGWFALKIPGMVPQHGVNVWDPLLRELRTVVGPLRLERCVRLGGGVSAVTHRLDLSAANGAVQSIVVKLPKSRTPEQMRECARVEFLTLEALRGAGLGAPVPRLLDVSGRLLGTPGMVLEYLPGAVDFAPARPYAMLREMARRLAQIHTLPVEQRPLAHLPLRHCTVEQLVYQTPQELDRTLNEADVRAALRANWPRLRRVRPCLLHGDYWPGNLLWTRSGLLGVIDWEEAEMGDPLADLAVARLDVLWAFGWAAMDRFTDFYRREMNTKTLELPVWDLVAALRPMSKLAAWATALHARPIGRVDLTTDVLAEHHQLFVKRALAAL